MVTAALVFVLFACAPSAATVANRQAPPMSRSDAERLMLRADDIKRSARDSPATARLSAVFAGPALQRLQAQAQAMVRRSVREEERNFTRTLIFWDPRAGEAVLQVVAESRLVTSDRPNASWAAIVRQWWARIEYSNGSWWVVDEADLPPDRWRVASPGGDALTGWVLSGPEGS